MHVLNKSKEIVLQETFGEPWNVVVKLQRLKIDIHLCTNKFLAIANHLTLCG